MSGLSVEQAQTDSEHIDHNVLTSVEKALSHSNRFLFNRWQHIQKHDRGIFDLKSLEVLPFQDDILVPLPELDSYLISLKQRPSDLELKEFSPPAQMIIFNPAELPNLSGRISNDRSYIIAKLQGFEDWVVQNLAAWIARKHDEHGCIALAELLKAYHALATVRYDKNPEALSSMLLTVFELWMALDRVATSICPLLAEYDAGVHAQVLQSLLLPLQHQMSQLDAVEKHLHMRCTRGGLRPNKLLYDESNGNSFAAQYFDQSPRHQDLYSAINVKAAEDKAKKLAELRQLKQEHARLASLIDGTSCETEEIYNDKTDEILSRCLSSCQRCLYIKERNELEIEYHEWPLRSWCSSSKRLSGIFVGATLLSTSFRQFYKLYNQAKSLGQPIILPKTAIFASISNVVLNHIRLDCYPKTSHML